MNALMTIQVRVVSAGALAKLKGVDIASQKAASSVGSIGRQAQWGLPYLSKWGNQVQWAGRQLIYNFTLPIALAMGAASKFALENEKAMTRVIKVYGDGSKEFRKLSKTEIPALEKAFVALSNRFGVHQAEVIGIAGDWAAAGASGIALAKSVKLTLETMVLGELDAASATKNLIAIQAQYGQDINGLTKTIDTLNMVENQTGTSMEGLMQGMARAAGVARDAGVDVRHLAAMMAALTPATGSAATAGNGLKTIISRILSPTQEGVEVMREMNVEVDSMSWQSLNAVERLEKMAGAFEGLSKAQRVHVSTVLASRWQINRFSQLMRDITNENGYYQKSLESTADATKIYAQRQFELNRVLESNPQRVKQAWVILQNAAADVIQPLLPTIAYLASELARLASAFANLDPEIQKLVLGGLIFLALIGPLARYIGSVSNLLGLMWRAIQVTGAGMAWIARGPMALFALAFKGIGTAAGGLATAVGVGVTKAIGFVKWFGIAMMGLPRLAMAGAVGLQNIFITVWSRILLASTAGMSSIRLIFAAFSTGLVGLWGALSAGIFAIWNTLTNVHLLKSTRTGLVKLVGMMNWAKIAMVAPWIALGAALIGIAYAFQDEIKAAWQNFINNLQSSGALNNIVDGWHAVIQAIIDAFWALPQGVRDALLTVLRIVQQIAVQVYDWLSYLNPFATHSPSLVDSVRKGMDTIEREYGRARGLGTVFKAAARDLNAFKKAAARSGGGEFQQERTDVKKSGGNLALFDRMQSHLNKLQPLMARQEAAVNRQQAVVDKWAAKLDRANAALDRQQNKLDRLQDRLSEVQAKYDMHEQKLQDFANAPIKGMGAMDDAIFANEMAQKKLRLELLKMEQVNGSVDDLRNRLAMLYGDIEELRGKASDLRGAGAGSEILGPINAQIAAMEAQANAMTQAVNNSPIEKMQSELEGLSKQGEILDLERSIKFDPMVREIDKLANAQEELSYDRIINGIKHQRAEMEALEPTIARLNRRIEEQEGVVAKYEAARDQVQQGYDREQAQLDKLQTAYQKTQDVVQNLESALRDMGQTASEALAKAKKAADKAAEKKKGLDAKKPKELSQAVKTFRAGEGAGWADVGQQKQIGRLGGMEDQSGMIEAFAQRELDKMNKIFGGFDMFAPIKKWWRSTWAWIKENVGPVVRAVGDTIMGVFGAIPNPFDNPSFKKGASNAWDGIKNIVKTVISVIKRIIELFWPDVVRVWEAIKDAGVEAWETIGPEVAKFGDLVEPLRKLLAEKLWPAFKLIAGVVGGAFLIALKLAASIFSHTIGPAIEAVVGIIGGLIQIVRGVVEVVVGLLTGDFKLAWQGIVDIVKGALDAVWAVIKGAWDLIVGVFWGLMHGIKEVWDWLVDILVGHSIIPDLIDSIFTIFKDLLKLPKWVWDNVLKPVWEFFVDLWNDTKDELNKWWDRIKNAWDAVKKAGEWFWDNVLKPVWEKVKKAWDDVKKELDKWWDNIKSAWNNITSNISDWWQNNIWNPVKNKVTGAWNDFRAEIAQWWERIKTTWNNITSNIGDWWVNNIWNPVKNKVSGAWTDIRTEIGDWWERMKNTWSNITNNIGSWFKNNVTDPIFNKVTGVWEDIKNWFNNHKDIITGPISNVVNGAISAINWMIRGLNKISDVLPGLDWKIELIGQLASGGEVPRRRVGNGFVTSGARAIVGEGKANYPEYVIPTDPTYRSRAQSLVQSAASRVGVQTLPQYAIGGVLGDTIGDIVGKASDMAKGGLKWMEGNVKKIASTLFGPMEAAANKLIGKIGWMPAQTAVKGTLREVIRWVTAADEVFNKKAEKIAEETGSWNGKVSEGIRAAQNFAKSQVGKPYVWGGASSGGYDCSGFMSVITNYLRGKNPPWGRLGSTATFPWAGFPAGRGAFTIGSTPNYGGSGVGHMAGTLGNLNVESAGGVGVRVGSAARGWNDSGFTEHAHLAGLAKGAIIRRTAGGVWARMGEGRYDEAVTPLPRDWRSKTQQSNAGEGNTYNFYGNLEFPNITSGDDAEEFIANLERVV